MGAREGLGRAVEYTGEEALFRRHPELLAAELRGALDTLGQITGTISPDEILGRISSGVFASENSGSCTFPNACLRLSFAAGWGCTGVGPNFFEDLDVAVLA